MSVLPALPLLLIADRRLAGRPLDDVIQGALRGGCRWLSLRGKEASHEQRLDLLARLAAIARPYGARLGVHGDLQAACALGLDAIHLPSGSHPAEARQRLGPSALIGVSAHSTGDVLRAGEAGADYATLSPIFPTASKPGYGPALGLDGLRTAAQVAPIPILALGGIAATNAPDTLAAGASGLAVLGAIMAAPDPARATAQIVSSVRRPQAQRLARFAGG